MKAVQLALVGILFALSACASSVGRWEGESKGSNAAALRGEVRESLLSSNWVVIEDTHVALAAVRAGTGGQRTIADFKFADVEKGSTFVLTGGSHHRFNWATFGILGLAMRNQAGLALTSWYEEWLKKHPKG